MSIYADSIIVSQPLLLISGQTPQQGDVTPDSIGAQLDVVIRKIDNIIKNNNHDVSKIAKVNIYITDKKYLVMVREKLAEYLSDTKPVMTLVIVAGLIDEHFKVEIDATVST